MKGFTSPWEPLADWEMTAHNGRQVYIVYDSDVMLNPHVHEALVLLKRFLEMRKARVALIYLPIGEGGKKVGLDDYLAFSHSTDELFALPNDKLRTPAQALRDRAKLRPEVPLRHTCGGTKFWQDQSGKFHCASCHPPEAPSLVADWCEP